MSMSAENSSIPLSKPPPRPPGAFEWLRQNLFKNWFNTLLTIVSVVIIYFLLQALVRWVVFFADWSPITEFPLLFMVGQYPREQIWRIGVTLTMLSIMMGVSWGAWRGLIQSFAITLGALLGVVALLPVQMDFLTVNVRIFLLINVAIIFAGYMIARMIKIPSLFVVIGWTIVAILVTAVFLPGFRNNRLIPYVPTTVWGGLMVTMLLSVGGVVLSFPIGVLLALGRRSSLPVVKVFSTAFIETIRGVPLITILFMFSLILQVFLPIGSRFDRLLRALIGITIFSAAYMAENVRGGLQAIPLGQEEAAKAVGMNAFQINLFIVLPQALRLVIPAIVGQFISLFKDTTLVIILGINELLGIGRSVINASPEFVQLQLEVYAFIALLFWIISYAMSYSSRQLESALGVGER
jgi:general L-amino acid transport system permease protein